MKQLRFAEFTHANTRRKIFLNPNQVWSVYASETDKTTHIVAYTGTFCPVLESVDEVKRELLNALGESQDE